VQLKIEFLLFLKSKKNGEKDIPLWRKNLKILLIKHCGVKFLKSFKLKNLGYINLSKGL
jgi:hypothetical protein